MTGTDDVRIIEGVIQSYLDGLYESDAGKIASVFHPTSALTRNSLPRHDEAVALRPIREETAMSVLDDYPVDPRLSLLEKTRIQAQVLVPVLRALRSELGKKELTPSSSKLCATGNGIARRRR